MKCAVLCNGPSKDLYIPSSEYGFVIGCNIPWTKVDATVILDEQVIRLWAKKPDLITVPAYFSVKAWAETDAIKKREFFRPFLIKMITPKYPYHSSGHNAVEQMIREGYTEIDIFGCDSYYSKIARSHTRTYIKDGGVQDGDMKAILGWRERWKEIIDGHPEVTLNFIKESNQNNGEVNE
jgi:hypothetical protein